MVKLIMGLSGSGKTKTLISLVSEAIEKEQGNVVCIEKSRHLTYDIPYQARLIRTDDYGVRGNTMLLGFLCGLHAGNYDITHFFIDDLNKILDDAPTRRWRSSSTRSPRLASARTSTSPSPSPPILPARATV